MSKLAPEIVTIPRFAVKSVCLAVLAVLARNKTNRTEANDVSDWLLLESGPKVERALIYMLLA